MNGSKEHDRDKQTQTSAASEHANKTGVSGRDYLFWNSLRASSPFEGVARSLSRGAYATSPLARKAQKPAPK